MATIDDVRQIYANILQRSGTEVTAAEINSYVSAIDSGALTLAQARSALINSTEGQDVQDVVRLYQTVFGRVPDQAGLNNQVDTLRGPANEADIANSFAASPEFTTRFGGNTVNSAFINSVYQQVLGRTPSAGEVDFYLNSGFSAGRIALAFSEAPEFRTRVDSAAVAFLDQAGQGTAVFNGPLVPPATGTIGSTFTLTAGVDGPGATTPGANLTATAGNDTFSAVLDATAANGTLQLTDAVDGQGGTDTFNLRVNGAVNLNATTSPTLTSIEVLNVTNLAGATNVDASIAPGLTTLNSVGSLVALTATNLAAATNTLGLSNIAADGANLTATYKAGLIGKADAVTLNVSNNSAADTTTATNFADVVLAGAAGGDGVDILNVVSNGGATRLDTLSVSDNAAATLTNLNISGASDFRVNNAITFAGTTGTVDASKATGAVNLTFAANDLTVTGGSGNDRFNFGTSLTSADKVNGSAGTNTLAIGSNIVDNGDGAATDATKALNAAVNGQTSIQVLELTQASAAVSASSITNINTFAFTNAAAGAIVVTNVETADTFQLKSDGTSAAFSVRVDGASDVVNLQTTGADFTGNVGGANFETINLNVTNGDAADDTTFGTLTAGTNGKITITGAGDVGFTVVGTNAIIDAGALTGKLTVVGEAGNNVITGGLGNDIITGAGGIDTIDLTKGGTDVVRFGTTAASRDTVTGFSAGAGGDIIDVGTQDATATTNDGVAAAAFKDFTGTQPAYTFATATQTVQEFSFNATNNSANLPNATDGTELFKAIANQGSTITGITGAANSAGEIVAYQNGNAYIYHYASVDTTIDATEVVLVGTLTGVAVGALTDANFA